MLTQHFTEVIYPRFLNSLILTHWVATNMAILFLVTAVCHLVLEQTSLQSVALYHVGIT